MKKPKLTLLIPLALLFILMSSSFALNNFSSKNAAMPTVGYHPETNSVVLATDSVALPQQWPDEGPWIFTSIAGMQLVDLYAYAIDSDVEDADIEPPGDPDVLYEHGLWKCEWYVDGNLVATDNTPSDYGAGTRWGSVRVFNAAWNLAGAATKAWLTDKGPYEVEAVIYDLAGNTVTTDSVLLWIDPTLGDPFTLSLPEMAYMGGDLMRFETTDADPTHVAIYRIDGCDAAGNIVVWIAGVNLSETDDYNDRNLGPLPTGYMFRYFDTLTYEMPTWLPDGLYNFTFIYTQPSGLYSYQSVNLVEVDNNARDFFIPEIRHFVPVTPSVTYPDGWMEVPYNPFVLDDCMFQDGDMIEITVEYDEAWNPNGLDQQNGTLLVDFGAIDSATGMIVLNDLATPGVKYNDTDVLTALGYVPAAADAFHYNYTVAATVSDGDYYLPVYSKSILGHYYWVDQDFLKICIDNTAIGFTYSINSPTGIYWNETVIEIDIVLDNPDPTAWVETVGPWVVLVTSLMMLVLQLLSY
jgi:hypothetical protein